MKKILSMEELRLTNLQALVNEAGGIPELANQCGANATYLSQIINRRIMGERKPREVGSKLARKLEAGCGKPTGWMDVDHNAIYPDAIDDGEKELRAIYEAMNSKTRKLFIEQGKLILKLK